MFQDSVYDALFNNNVGTKVEKNPSSVSSNSTKKASSKANNTDDFSYLFGMGGNSNSSHLPNLCVRVRACVYIG